MYSLLLILGIVLSLPYYLLLILVKGKYRASFWGKFGLLPEGFLESVKDKRVIWIHAVSVGEVAAAAPIVRGLKDKYKDRQLVISTTTETGQAHAARLFPEIPRCYMPLDLTFLLKHVMDPVSIELFVILETELWPNLIRYLCKRKIKTILANGRLSDGSFRRYLRFKSFFKEILQMVHLFLVQSDLDGERFSKIGAPEERIIVAGNTKFDQVKAASPPEDLMMETNILVAGSTHPGEDEIILEAYLRLLPRFPTLHLVLVPRHPERASQLEALCLKHHLPCTLRSQGGGLSEPVLIVDTVGELSRLYALASVAFVGGSLVPKGGQNLLEPAIYGIPVLTGPHTENFREIAALLDGNGLWRVHDAEELAEAVANILTDPEGAQAVGETLQRAVLTRRGATALTLTRLDREIAS